ncbi:MAG: GTPase Era [Cyanobacteria bacterium P01_H01_bin.74]
MYRSGFVVVLGRPSVGKSTLVNALVGQHVAITSHVAQTTRHRIKGVLHSAKGQAVLLDTPGFSKPLDKLGTYLVEEGFAALNEADIAAVVVDASVASGKGDAWLARQVLASGKPVFLILNQVDKLKHKPGLLEAHCEQYKSLFSQAGAFKSLRISAKTGKNLRSLADTLIRELPQGPAYFNPDTVTDQRIREMSAEIIREKVLMTARDEIPHSVAVGIETFDESNAAITHINATLYVNQPSQKGILIGKDAAFIKQIGAKARKDIEALLEKKVHLALQVKTRQNWRKDSQFLKSLGLALPESALI